MVADKEDRLSEVENFVINDEEITASANNLYIMNNVEV